MKLRIRPNLKKIIIISFLVLFLYLVISLFIFDLGALKVLRILFLGVLTIVFIFGLLMFSDFLWGTTDVLTYEEKRIFWKLFVVLGPVFFIGFFLYFKSDSNEIKTILLSILFAVLAFSFILGIYETVLFIKQAFKEGKTRKKDKE